MRTHSRNALWLALAALGSACNHLDRRPVADSSAPHPITVSQQSTREPDSLSSNDERVAVRRPQRFGRIHVERGGATCLRIDADSLPAGTEIQFVNPDQIESSGNTQHLGKAVTIGAPRGRCADSSTMAEGEVAYHLRVLSGDPKHAIGIFGPLDTLRIEDNRAVAVFPGDTAHWRFWTCASTEGLHDEVGRQSADSLIELWDGYTYLGYDMEGTCHGARDVAIANEKRSLLARWEAGNRDRETVMRLLIARWRDCNLANEMPGDDPPDPDSTAGLPSMAAMLKALGAPNELTSEEDFVIGTLAEKDNGCLGKTLGESATGLRVVAARREPSSALFSYMQGPHGRRHGSVNAAAAELHRRFEHRGEFYRQLFDDVRFDLSIH